MENQPDHSEDSYVGSGRLEGKRAVITGGDSGIGRAVAIAFARERADVLISYLPEEEEEDGQVTAGHIRDAGRKAVTVPGDLRSEEQCVAVVETALRELGGIDTLVNNAAYQMAQENGILDVSTEQFDRVMKTNLYAMFWITKAALPHLKAGASIINVLDPGLPAEPAADRLRHHQGRDHQLHPALAQQVAEQGIRVNTVAPGPIWTPLIPATMPEGKVDGFGEDTPTGRTGQPAELAPAFVFFASQESSDVTGERLGVTGGKLMP